MTPNFSADRIRPYPWSSLRRLSRDEAAVESALAHWLSSSSLSSSTSGTSPWPRMRKLLRLDLPSAIQVRAVGARAIAPAIATPAPDDPHTATKLGASAFTPTAHAIDPHAAIAIVRIDDVPIEVVGSSAGVRAIVQRLLGGPDELAAPRPLGVVEQSLWTLVVATALEDLGLAGHVWPVLGPASSRVPAAAASSSPAGAPRGDGDTRAAAPAARLAKSPSSSSPSSPPSARSPSGAAPTITSQTIRLSFDVRLGDMALAVEARLPREITVRAPTRTVPARTRAPAAPTWVDRIHLDVPITVGRCAIHRDDLRRLAVRSLVTLERPATGAMATLEILGGTVGLTTRPGALVAEVTTGYVRRDMALPDEAHAELSVALGTTQLTLRQITELTVGQIVQLGRPLGGPFELRVAGRVLGRGELVDVDGELAVRIVSLGD